MDNRVIHFEIQADDVNRAKDFYEKAFGWKIAKAEMADVPMDYWMLDTGTGPGIGGGMYQRPKENVSHFFDCTISVPDIDVAVAAVKANGGIVVTEKSEMKGIGWFARAKDTEGNTFGLMQPTEWQPK